MKKRILAREVLVFFGCIVIIGLLSLYPMIANLYWQAKLDSREAQSNSITQAIAALPTDYNVRLYEMAKRKMIPDDTATSLLSDGSHGRPVTDPKILAQLNDDKADSYIPTIAFSDFERKIQNENYRDSIAYSIGQSIEKAEIVASIGYNNSIAKQISGLESQRKYLDDQLQSYSSKEFSANQTMWYIATSAIVLFLVAYVLRFSIVAVFWAINIIKKGKESTPLNS